MKTDLIIKTLRDWSPHGLCSGVLVQENGSKRKTEACALGCLALGFLSSRVGSRWLFKHYKRKNAKHRFIQINLRAKAAVDHDEFREAMHAYYGTDDRSVDHIMFYNDDCPGDTSDTRGLPKKLTAAICKLRKQYEDRQEFLEEQERERANPLNRILST